ncbi:MAG: hypothetical protein V3U65_01830 [Granulosicoccaceae bacterium]
METIFYAWFMASSPKRRAPTPIFDNLNHIDSNAPPLTLSGIDCSVEFSVLEQDARFVTRFLLSYDGSSATFNAYRRELERLCQWSWLINASSICKLTREDIEQFVRFALNPPKAWIGVKNVARFANREGERQPNSNWRPFVAAVSKEAFESGEAPDIVNYAPSHATTRATFTALSSFYDYLQSESVISSNPVKLIRQKSKFIRKDQGAAVVRRLSNLQWDYLIETAELMADNDPEEHERTLFIITALFGMYLRISELVADERSAPVMSDFRADVDKNWWFHVTGKGNKDRTVTVSQDMLKALKRYRRSQTQPALPSPNNMAPLIPKLKGSGPVSSTRHIRLIVQRCFDAALARMIDDGMSTDAQELKASTVHWLRHTGISEDVKVRPREHVRDDAGHATMATTDRYVDSDRRERHQSARKKRLRDL